MQTKPTTSSKVVSFTNNASFLSKNTQQKKDEVNNPNRRASMGGFAPKPMFGKEDETNGFKFQTNVLKRRASAAAKIQTAPFR